MAELTTLLHPNGVDLYDVPGNEVQGALDAGYKAPTPEFMQERASEAKYGSGAANTAKAFGIGALSSVPFGLLAATKGGLIDKDEAKELLDRHQIAAAAGELGGYGAQFLTGTSALGAANKGVSKLAGKVVNSALAGTAGSAVEGALWSGNNML